MYFTEWKEKIAAQFDKLKGSVLDLLAKGKQTKSTRIQGTGTAAFGKPSTVLTVKFSFFIKRFREIFSPGHVPGWRKPLMLFGFGGLAVLFLILIIAAAVLNFGKPKESSVQNLAAGPAIPQEELFIPAEPDFLPEFLLEREPRRFWSLEDIRPYWKNPGDPERWRGEIKSAVDKLMEGVP